MSSPLLIYVSIVQQKLMIGKWLVGVNRNQPPYSAVVEAGLYLFTVKILWLYNNYVFSHNSKCFKMFSHIFFNYLYIYIIAY
jgi:hypothetical protein